MGFIKSLCCGSASRSSSPEPIRHAAPNGDQHHPNEKSSPDLEISKLPEKPDNFISYLNGHGDNPTKELLQPYQQYELGLRKAFAQGKSAIDSKANLVPIYSKRERQLKIRKVDRRDGDPAKYLMRLPDTKLRGEGSSATAETLEDYKVNFDAFTHGSLSKLGTSKQLQSSRLLTLLKTGLT